MYYKDEIKIGCDRYLIVETKKEDIYKLINTDDLTIKPIITGSLYDCICKAVDMFKTVLWEG